MLITDIKYNKATDQNSVYPGRSIDLRLAFESGIVKSTGTVTDFNLLDDPSKIGARIEDEFDAVNHQRALSEAVHRNKVTRASSTPCKTDVSTPSGDTE